MYTAPYRYSPGIDFRHASVALGREKRARVLVPPGPPPPRGWSTCYLLHSFGGNRLSWLPCLDTLIESVEEPWLFVFPESGRRWFINDHAGYSYEDYILQDLVPAIDRAFPTAPEAGYRLLGGFSMGGAAAVYLSLRHSSLFPAAFSYAGAFYASRREGDPYAGWRSEGCMMPTEEEHNRVWGPPGSAVRSLYDPERLADAAAAGGSPPRLVFQVGLDDYPRVLEQNRKMSAALASAGLAHLYEEGPGDHSWPCAARGANRALLALGSLRRSLSGSARVALQDGRVQLRRTVPSINP